MRLPTWERRAGQEGGSSASATWTSPSWEAKTRRSKRRITPEMDCEKRPRRSRVRLGGYVIRSWHVGRSKRATEPSRKPAAKRSSDTARRVQCSLDGGRTWWCALRRSRKLRAVRWRRTNSSRQDGRSGRWRLKTKWLTSRHSSSERETALHVEHTCNPIRNVINLGQSTGLKLTVHTFTQFFFSSHLLLSNKYYIFFFFSNWTVVG